LQIKVRRDSQQRYVYVSTGQEVKSGDIHAGTGREIYVSVQSTVQPGDICTVHTSTGQEVSLEI
jgi:hypothetical protein